MTETVLVVNAGSSSIKFQLFSLDARDQLKRLLKGQMGIGVHPKLSAKGTDGKPIEEFRPPKLLRNVRRLASRKSA